MKEVGFVLLIIAGLVFILMIRSIESQIDDARKMILRERKANRELREELKRIKEVIGQFDDDGK